MVTDADSLKRLLEGKFAVYHQADFIDKDPISVPHRFSKKQDIEIAAFFAAILAWGNRRTIINKTNQLLQWMDDAPHDFVLNHQAQDLRRFQHFVHRTFNTSDLLYTLSFFQAHYRANASLETAFAHSIHNKEQRIQQALTGFHHYFFSFPHAPERTRKHIATPERKSGCKRLNMFFRWMVRRNSPVDFGLWQQFSTADLICPLDTHVGDVARRLGLLERSQNDWQSALELTEHLKQFDAEDPAKYDFALFALGAEERF